MAGRFHLHSDRDDPVYLGDTLPPAQARPARYHRAAFGDASPTTSLLLSCRRLLLFRYGEVSGRVPVVPKRETGSFRPRGGSRSVRWRLLPLIR